MRPYIISTDVNADLPQYFIEENEIINLPLYYKIGDEVYGDEQILEPSEFYDRMRSGDMPSSMATNPAVILDAFQKKVDEGYDILHISFSSALSSSHNNVCMCANELMEEHPECNITVIDSLSASLGQGLLVYYAVQMKKEGKSLEEVATWVRENIQHSCHQFTVDDLFHLHRGGRVSIATAVLGTIANIKPLLHVNPEGKLINIGKIRGRKQSLKKLVDRMKETVGTQKNDIIFISHGDCEEDVEFVKSLIEEYFDIHNFMVNFVNPSIGTHSGPGTVALFYLGDER